MSEQDFRQAILDEEHLKLLSIGYGRASVMQLFGARWAARPTFQAT
jgi:hypothetical protein